MRQKLYVGNLPFSATETDVRKIFREYEPVHSVLLMADRDSKTSRGFGFVELEDSSAAAAASELNMRKYNGRTLRVSPATGGCPKYAANGGDRANNRANGRVSNNGIVTNNSNVDKNIDKKCCGANYCRRGLSTPKAADPKNIRRRVIHDINQYDTDAHEYSDNDPTEENESTEATRSDEAKQPEADFAMYHLYKFNNGGEAVYGGQERHLD